MNYIVSKIVMTDGIPAYTPCGYVVGIQSAIEFNNNNTGIGYIALPQVGESLEGLPLLPTSKVVD